MSTIERDLEITDPEFRTRVLTTILGKVALSDGPVNVLKLQAKVRSDLEVSEEWSSMDIRAATFLLVRSGLLVSDDYQNTTVEESFTTGADTTVTASRQLINLIWSEYSMEPDPECQD